MALRSVLRKVPALGLSSPAGPLMGPSPARHMSYSLRPDPSSRLNKLFEKMGQTIAREEKVDKVSMATVERAWEKCDKKTKLSCYAVHCFSAFLVLRHLF